MIKSLNQFDQQKVRGVVGGLLSKTDRDHCFVGIYYRAKANVESLLSLKYVRDVQASLMIARSLFEPRRRYGVDRYSPGRSEKNSGVFRS